MLGFSSTSLFPARKREAVTQGGATGTEPPDEEEKPKEPTPSMAGRKSETTDTFQIDSRKTRIMRA